jgi:hypothetical protein
MNKKGQILLGILIIAIIVLNSFVIIHYQTKGKDIIEKVVELKEAEENFNQEQEVEEKYVGEEIIEEEEDKDKDEDKDEEVVNEEIVVEEEEEVNETEEQEEEEEEDWYEFNYNYWHRNETPYGEQICINWSVENVGEEFYYNSIREKATLNGELVYNYGATPQVPIFFDERHDTWCLTIEGIEVDRIYVSGSYKLDDLKREFNEKIKWIK